MALTCFLFPVVGLTAYGAALGPTIRLMPPLLAGVGNEDREGPPSVGSSSQVAQQMRLYRKRRREGLQLVRIPLRVTEIDDFIRPGTLG
jgi:hypothetical protein